MSAESNHHSPHSTTMTTTNEGEIRIDGDATHIAFRERHTYSVVTSVGITVNIPALEMVEPEVRDEMVASSHTEESPHSHTVNTSCFEASGHKDYYTDSNS